MANYCPHCMRETQGAVCTECGKDVYFTGKYPHLQVGTTLHGKQTYILGASLGQGGFGITYIALKVETMERVAVKEYFPTYWCQRGEDDKTVQAKPGNDREYQRGMRKFYQEAQNIYRFRDLDTVVNIQEFFQQNGTCYIVMEYLDGENLKNLVERTGRLAPAQLFKKLEPIMQDLEKMHRGNPPVLHRDIAPDNIMMLKSGGVALLDFGSARSCQTDDKGMTKFIKPGYSPVEQYFKEGSQGPYSDIYSLAATIYFALTEKTPPDATNRQSTVLMNHEADPLEPLGRYGVVLKPGQEQALMDALKLDSKTRTQTVEELRNALCGKKQPASSPRPGVDLKILSTRVDRNNRTATVVWQGELPRGAVFEVLRSVDGTRFQHLGRTEDHKYLDTLPYGAKKVQYRVQRLNQQGESKDLSTGNTVHVEGFRLPSLPKLFQNTEDPLEAKLLTVFAVLLVLLIILVLILLL